MTGPGRALLWRRAPFVLRHFPGVLAGILAATAVLALASASAPLFFSSAASRAVAQRIADVSPWQAGLMVRQPGSLRAWGLFEERSEALRRAAAGEPHLGAPVATVLGTAFLRPATGGRGAGVMLVTRTGFRSHVEPLAAWDGGELEVAEGSAAAFLRECPRSDPPSGGAPRVWVTGAVAKDTGVCPGDTVAVGPSGTAAVAGVYRDLRVTRPDQFWALLGPDYEPESAPALAIADLESFREFATGHAMFRWEVPVRAEGLTLAEASSLARSLRAMVREIRSDGGDLSHLFPERAADSLLLDIERISERMVSRTRAPVNLLAGGGTLLALAVTAAAGLYGLRRRRVELNALLTRGMSPWSVGARAGLEALLPALGGGVAGWAVCVVLLRAVGPSSSISPEAIWDALGRALWTVIGGVVLLGVVTGAGTRAGPAPRLDRARGALAAVPWDLALLGLAYLAWRAFTERAAELAEARGATPAIDVWVLVFPVLLVAGATGVATRALRWMLPKLRVAGAGLSAPLFLAARRLAAASRTALSLVTIASVSVGVFLYAGTLSASGRATVDAKALTFIGSDVSVPMNADPPIPAALESRATVVTKVYGAQVTPSLALVDLLAIDPATFARAAFWDDSFADRSLDELLDDLALRPGDGDTLRAVAVGASLDDDQTVTQGGASSALRVVGEAESWPGTSSGKPVLVVDQRAIEPPMDSEGGTGVLSAGARHELWARGDPEVLLEQLGRAGVTLDDALTLTEVADATSLLPLQWSFGFLQALGAATGIMALVGMLLYLQARQASRVVAGALVARMGLTRSQHATAIAMELGCMLVVSFALGTSLSALAADLAVARLDPLPQVPPPPLLRVPVNAIALIGVLLLAAAVVGAWRVQRSAERANVAEVLRVAD